MFEMINNKPGLFASCDLKYFNEFGSAMINSVLQNTDNVMHIHIINIDDVDELNNEYNGRITFSREQMDKPNKAKFASNRFIRLPEVLKYSKGLFIIDIDAVVNKHVDFPNSDWGVFLRPPLPGTSGIEYYATHVAAGAVWMTPEVMDIAVWISNNINELGEKNNWPWFIDQYVIYRAYEKYKDKFNFKAIESKYIDWEFKDDSVIWTGKGPRKYNNEKFVGAVRGYKK